MKKILVIDDSALMRRMLSDIIDGTSEYIVSYTATNGKEGLDIIQNKNDIMAVFCDLNMPVMSGLELLQVARERGIDIPFVVCSSSTEQNDTIMALELGALEFIKKPDRIFDKASDFTDKIHKALHISDSVYFRRKGVLPDVVVEPLKVIETPKVLPPKSESSFIKSSNSKTNEHKKKTNEHKKKTKATSNKKLVALVCSTGGPRALQRVIPKLPANLRAPMIVVQHMPEGFTASMAERLDELSEIHVKEAEEGERLKQGVVYIAKGGTHLAVDGDVIYFDETPPIVGLKPCGNIMYKSLINSGYDEIICVVLTGMGADGTKGINELSKTNNIYVISQNEASSTVYGMPKAIYESGIVDVVCDLDKVAQEITKKVGV